MSYQLKLWDSKRENINWPEHTASRSQNKGTEQVHSAQTRQRQEAGGEGKGAGSAPRTASPTTLQTGLQFLSKDFLRFWMVDIRRRLNTGSKHPTSAGGN